MVLVKINVSNTSVASKKKFEEIERRKRDPQQQKFTEIERSKRSVEEPQFKPLYTTFKGKNLRFVKPNRLIKKRRKRKLKIKYDIMAYITITKSNIFIVICKKIKNSRKKSNKMVRKIIYQRSAGAVHKMGGRKRRTEYAGGKLGIEAGKEMRNRGFKKLICYVKAGGSRKKALAVMRGLVKGGLYLKGIKTECAIPHNGVRRRKKRRL